MEKLNLDKLKSIVSINSYSTNRDGVNKKLDLIEKYLEDLPVKIERTPDDTYGDFMVIRTKSIDEEKPKIGLILHTDTVHKPEVEFPIKIVEDKLYGPGVQDMQTSIFVVIEVLNQLNETDKLENLVIVLNPCEEKGSPEFQEIFEEISQELDYVMVYETGSNGKFGENTELDDHDFILVDSRKGIFQQIISTHGPGGHSGELSQPRERKNAIIQATKMINKIEQLQDFEKETTINIACIEGGQENTTIAEDCRFVFDARFRFESERQRLKDAISEILETEYVPGVKVIDHGYNYDLPSLQPNELSEEFFDKIKSFVLKSDTDLTVQKAARGGWSDGCNMYEYNPDLKVLDGFGPKGGGEHSKEEFVYLESINKSIQLTRLVIENLLAN